jgi:hypothetical protein
MAVVTDRPMDDENVAPIDGRPDHQDHSFGVTLAKTFPPYVYGIRGVSCVVHKILRVELHWWRVSDSGCRLVRMKRPVMIAITPCAQSFWLRVEVCRTCRVPNPDALLCGRCHGEISTFPKRGPARKTGETRQEAHIKLGCVVAGYSAVSA